MIEVEEAIDIFIDSFCNDTEDPCDNDCDNCEIKVALYAMNKLKEY